MFAEPVSRTRVVSHCSACDANRVREGRRRPFPTSLKSPLSNRKVFNLVPKFIDSGNVQE
jgi:hypothetical protein